MVKYAPLVPGITVYGMTLLVIVEAVQSFSVLREVLLETLEIEQIDVNRWYPQENVLRTYQKIESLLGGRGLERFGRMVQTRAVLPPGIVDAHSVLATLDLTYHMNHRRDGVTMGDPATGAMLEGIGHYRYKGRAGEREAVMECDVPYPCRFDLGLFHGFVARFEPTVQVTHLPGSCRAYGDPSCAYRASW